MKSFLKIFLASFLALLVFTVLGIVIIAGIAGGVISREEVRIMPGSVLYLDLSRNYSEEKTENPFAELTGDVANEIPTLYQLKQIIRDAEKDTSIKGIYIKSGINVNGYAASEEIRNALMEFRKTGKFVIAYGDYITQKAYYVSSAANKIYCNPKGVFEWVGMNVEYVFFKDLLNRLEIQPQIFYDGKFKSATEPFREVKMTDASRLQTEVWLGDIYDQLVNDVANSRKINSDSLRTFANDFRIKSPGDAVSLKLIDGAWYDDEVKDEIKKRLNIASQEKIEFITPGTYMHAKSLNTYGSTEKIALLVAEGDIVDGKGENGQIGAETYKNLIRKLRYNKDIKAIVLRVNSPGGSSLASEIIWRELMLAKKDGKPVVVSMGDVAASGGYYISCIADSIFVQPNTITGSIGVFSIIPNMQGFFNKKLGITFDGVKTSNYADLMNVTRPLNDEEKKIIQDQVDRIYLDFKSRVSNGRKKDTAYIDSIAQGRVWTGKRAIQIGLADALGGIDESIRSAAVLAGLKKYQIRVYPEPKTFLQELIETGSIMNSTNVLEKELGQETYLLYKQIKNIKESTGKVQARLPYTINWK